MGDLWLGIDPGREGFLCAFDGEAIRAMIPIPMIDNRPDLVRLGAILRKLKHAGVGYALVEKQIIMGREGARNGFTIGAAYYAILMGLVMVGIRFEEIEPDRWKKEAGIPAPAVKGPKLRRKPATKRGIEQWKKEATKARERVSRQKRQKRKDLAVRKATQLQPDYDFRLSEKHKKPHDGKCEAFLLALLASRRERG